jgi:hypothetical protein
MTQKQNAKVTSAEVQSFRDQNDTNMNMKEHIPANFLFILKESHITNPYLLNNKSLIRSSIRERVWQRVHREEPSRWLE